MPKSFARLGMFSAIILLRKFFITVVFSSPSVTTKIQIFGYFMVFCMSYKLVYSFSFFFVFFFSHWLISKDLSSSSEIVCSACCSLLLKLLMYFKISLSEFFSSSISV